MIKKILSLIALVASVAACTDDYKDWANPQVVPQPDAVSFTDGNVSAVGVINFADFMPGQTTVKVCNITAPTASQETYAPVYSIQLGDNTYELTADGAMRIGDLEEYVEGTFGKAPIERTIDATVSMWLDNKLTSVKTGTAKVIIKAVPNAPFIDTGYWLTGDFAGWNKEGALPFTHLGGGDVYDNPEFQIVFTTTADNQYWKIIPQNNYDNDFWAGGEKGVVGTVVDGDTSMEGMLVTDNPQAGKIEAAGIYRMTINMMNYTYKIEKMNFSEFIYVPGNAQKYNTSAAGMPEWGWTPELAPALRSANFDGVYVGFAYMDGEFKFTKERNWSAEYNYDSFNTYDPIFTGEHGTGGNINCTEAGYYRLVADVAGGSLKATKLTWGLVGPATPGGWDAGAYTVMTYNMADDCWEITTDLAADEFKFTTNGSWDINLGGKLDDLSEGGGNLRIDEAGKYTIKLYPSRSQSDKMYATIVKQ